MADFAFDEDSSASRRRMRGLGTGAKVVITGVVSLTAAAGAAGGVWWVMSSRGPVSTIEPVEKMANKATVTSSKTEVITASKPDPAAVRRQWEQERKQEALQADMEKQSRKVELLKQLSDVDASERRRCEPLTALIASLKDFIPRADFAVKERRQVVAKLEFDIKLGRAFGAPGMAGGRNSREALLELYLGQLRLEEAALTGAVSRLENAEIDLKAARDEASAKRRRINRELEG